MTAPSRDESSNALDKGSFEANVLVADDNEINQKVAWVMLEQLGCKVEIVSNGRMALEAVADRVYDLVLMDCRMPEMDGFDATREIRRRERLNKSQGALPIVALTANTMTGDRDQCLASGMDDYLSKPVKLRDLAAVLHRWLDPDKSPMECQDLTTADRGRENADTNCDVLDPTSLDDIRGLQREGAPNLLVKYIEIFLRNSPGLLENIREAVNSNQPERLVLPAHSLKSDGANLGAKALQLNCKQLEEMGRLRCMDDAANVLAQLEEAYAATCVALQQELEPVT